MLLKLLAPVLPVLLAGSPDEVRLDDGRVLVGPTVQHGDTLEITTRTGVVTVAREHVRSIRTDDELRHELTALRRKLPDDAHCNLELARTALRWRLEREMWHHLDRCLELAGSPPTPPRRVAELLGQLEPEILPARFRDATPEVRVRALVRRVRDSAGPARCAAIVELLVAEPGAEQALQTAAKREPLAEQRLAAMTALVRRGAPDGADFVTLRAVADRDDGVRRDAARLVASAGGSRRAVARLTPGLLHDSPAIRMRTAEAFARLGDASAVPRLVEAGPLAGTPRRAGGGIGSRQHMAVTTSRSYIRDFDVEIAQSAAVANPQIGVARSGVVFDVNVPAVITQRVQIAASYRRALRDLTGSDPGPDPARWAGWLACRTPSPNGRGS